MEIRLNEPQFDENTGLYSSKINSGVPLKIRSPGMRYLSGEERFIYLEFLPSGNQLYKIIKSFDETVIKQIVANGEAWFGKQPNPETIERLLVPSINLPVDLISYPYVVFETSNNLELFNESGKMITIHDLKPDSEISVVFVVDGVIFLQNKIEIVYVVETVEILKTECREKRYVSDESEESESTTI